MRKIINERLGETLYMDILPNGLTVLLLPRVGYQQVFSMFTTKYGSMDNAFKLSSANEYSIVPDGIAHFLEHKMFEQETGDVFHEFASHGASANAFTTFDSTSYLFSCTEDVNENVETLLNFVQGPYFTRESVEKEKGIIGQEIRMYDDNPEWRAFFGLLRALFVNHPVRIDIAGTVESIAQITPETLYKCYETFYHPGNMLFCITGGFNPDEMYDIIRKNQDNKAFAEQPLIQRRVFEEPVTVNDRQVTAYLPVIQPRCLVGWKEKELGLQGESLLLQETVMGVVLDILFGRGSRFYQSLVDDELTDSQFSWEYELTETYGYSVVGGNTPNPDELIHRLHLTVKEAIEQGIQREDFERNRKKTIGRFISSLDSPSGLARVYSAYYLRHADYFKTLDILRAMTLEDVNERLKQHFDADCQAVSIVRSNPLSNKPEVNTVRGG